MRMRRDQFSTLARGMQPYQNKPGVATIIAPGGGEGASSAGYVAGHIKDPDTGIAYGYHWGINGGPDDQSAKLQAMINEIGENGGGRIVIRSRVPTDPITINQLTSIYHDNVHIEFRSPVKLNAVGGLRIMGRMDEYVRPPATNAGKLRANATEGGTTLLLDDAPGTMQATDFLDGDFIVVRGLNRADGNAIQKQYVFVKSRDLINNNLELSAELEETFQPFYGPGAAPVESSEYGPDATTGTTIYVIRNGQALANITRGMYEFEVTNIVNFHLFDLVRVADTRNEHDVNPSAIRGSGLPYENECNMEFARIIKITPTTGGKGIVTLDHAISKEYWQGAPYYAGISVVKPVQNSRISGYDISYSEEQTSKNYHAITIAFAFNCHTFNGYIDGYNYRRGQGVRIADSYLCSGYNLMVEGGLFDGPNPLAPGSGSGENYGCTLYKCTGCWYTDVITKDCRHGFLVQAASLFSLLNCQSWGDRISGFDLHGALEFDGVIDTCTAIRSNGHTPDAENGAGFRPGNTSHTPGAHHCIFRNCIAVGYQETNCAGFDFLPNSSNIEFNNCQVFGAYYGITFTRNSKQVTPVQDCEHIRIINCTFYDCIDRAVRVIGAPTYDNVNSNGKIKGLTIKGCNTVRCSRHYVIDGNLGVENLLMEGNDIIDPVALSGQYAYDIKDLNGYNSFRNNGAIGANKGMFLQNVQNATVVTNVLTPTVEAVDFTDGGGNTGLQYVDVFSGGSGSYVPLTLIDDKGDIFVGTSPDTATIVKTLGVADGYVMTVNAAAAAGITWSAIPQPNYLSSSASVVPLAPMWKGTHIQGAGTDGIRFWAGYTGYNIYWNGTTWQIGTDGGSNGATLVLASGVGDTLQVFQIPSTGTGSKTVTPANLANYLVVPDAGTPSFTTDITATANTPRIVLYESDVASGERRVHIQQSAGVFQVRLTDDAGSTGATIFSITRAANVATVAALNATTIELNGAVQFGSLTNFYASASGSNPLINLDVTDYWLYTRSTNTLDFLIGNVSKFKIAPSQIDIAATAINLGGNTVVSGSLQVGLTNFYLSILSSVHPLFNLDANDYFWYDRTANRLATVLNSVTNHESDTTNALIVRGPLSTTALGYDNVRFGVLSGSPRIILEDASSTQWQIDNLASVLRFFIPGAVKAELDTSGNFWIAGNLGVAGNLGAWTSVTFASGWANNNSSTQSARYRKIGDIVFVEGYVERGGGFGNMIVFQLPDGYRPTKDFYFHSLTSTSPSSSAVVKLAWGYVTTAGYVTLREEFPAYYGTDDIDAFFINFNFSVL